MCTQNSTVKGNPQKCETAFLNTSLANTQNVCKISITQQNQAVQLKMDKNPEFNTQH